MSLRPPSTYKIQITATGDGGSSDPTRFTLAASGDSNVPGAIGATLHLHGIYFGPAADGLNLVATPRDLPAGVVAPQNITEAVPGPSFLEIDVQSINAATTAFPFQLWYGPLGPGAR